MLHKVAVLAYELFVRGRDDLDREGLEALLPAQGQDRIILFLLLGRPGLSLCQQLFEARFDLALLRLGGRSGPGLLFLSFVVRTVDVFVFDAFLGVVFHQ